jgi:hypothetical protein
MSKFLSLGTVDLLKGLLITVSGTVVASLITILNTGRLPNVVELKGIGIAALSVGFSYLVKNYFTNSQNKFAQKEGA